MLPATGHMIVFIIAFVAVCALAVVDDGFQTGAESGIGKGTGTLTETKGVQTKIGSKTGPGSDRKGRHKHGSKKQAAPAGYNSGQPTGKAAAAIGSGGGVVVAQSRPWFLSANGTSDFVRDLTEQPPSARKDKDKTIDDMRQQLDKAAIKQKSGR